MPLTIPTDVPQLTDDNVKDWIHQNFPKIKKEDPAILARETQYYFIADLLNRKQETYGTHCVWSANTKLGTSAVHAAPDSEDSVSIQDLMRNLTANRVHFKFDVSWVHEEILSKSHDGTLLFDLLYERWKSEQIGALEELEDKGWSAPINTTQGEIEPMGIPFWVQKDTSQTGFYGGNPSGWAAGAGNLSTTDVPEWANYTDNFSNVTHEDLGKKLKRAMRRMHYKRPVILNKNVSEVKPMNQVICVNETIKELLDVMYQATNDNLGRDFITPDPVIAGHEVKWVPQLDSDTDNPIYILDMNCLRTDVLKGDYFRESKVRNADRHNVYSIYIDLNYQFYCTNRRRQAVLVQV